MAVTLQKIRSVLNGRPIKMSSDENDDNIEIKGIDYFAEQRPDLLPDYAYVIKMSELVQRRLDHKNCFIIIADQPLDEKDIRVSGTKAILVNKDWNPETVVKRVRQLFEEQYRIGDSSIKILESCRKGYTIQQLLDLGYQLLNNPLLLVDVSLCFIAHSGGNNIDDEPLWEWTLSKGYVNKEYAKSVMTDDNQNEIEQGKEVLVIWETGLLNHRQLVGRVLKNNRPLAYLKLLEYHHPITESDQEILIMLCHAVAMTMEDANGSSHTASSLSDTFLIALLNQKMYDHKAIEERERIYGLKLYKNLFALVIRIDNRQNTNDRLYYLKRIYQNFFNRQTVIIYNGQLVILLDTITAEIQNEREMASFENLLEENDCTAGISKIFYHLYDFCEHYKQAHNALNLGDQLKKPGRIRNYDELIIPHMILSFRGETNIKNLIHPVVKALKDLDDKKGSNFLETLVAYINHNQDTTLTAKSLHVHYNTLKYRINRIIELTELDLSDSETLFNIQLSVKVNEILACL
ncbi:PucR family transcriptional regulator [Acetobacterium malicum]|uniref:PucR family transcriptional regulator n=1 Tax=Acetobacterium malicum TaxID=52692 RepID=UPI0003FB091F|nr:helix-turn-helix domain-containing protein [Acetobacterium dehalogenans]